MAGGVVLAVTFVVSITPWYHAYMDRDAQWTCAKLRKSIEWNYAALQSDGVTQYIAGSLDALEASLQRTNRSLDYAVEQIEDETDGTHFAIPGLCRDGGTFQVYLEDGSIRVLCDARNHDVDYMDLPVHE